MPQGMEWIILALLALVLFGANNLPKLGRNIGQGLREFKKGVRDIRDDVESSLKDEEPEAARASTATPAIGSVGSPATPMKSDNA
jgi:TatA/E family protein of Tat protein translocase